MKGKAFSGFMLTLLLIAVLPVSFRIQPVEAVTSSTVTYDYYVVAGHNMTPTPPSPGTSPLGFNFAVEPPVFNFGNVTYWGGRSYLYDGFAYSPYTKMTRFGPPMSGAKVNITNLLGYDITITALTAEVTDGTPTKDFFFTPGNVTFGNWTMVIVDTLDPGGYDECNYTTGMVEVNRLVDGDTYNKITGDPHYGERIQGPGSLLKSDADGDAVATGHVAPIALAYGSTFTEYFGVIIFGDADVGTQIDGTIKLSLTYEYTTPGCPVASFTYSPTEPPISETVTFNASTSYDPDGVIVSYSWDFGDETTGTGMIMNHTYNTPGNYTVVLNVTDNDGKWNSTSKSVRARDITPPTVSVLSPENTTYTSASVPLIFTVSEPTSWIGYSLDDQANVTISGNTTLTTMTNGSHSVIVYARDTAENTGASNKVFFTSEIPPIPVNFGLAEYDYCVVAGYQMTPTLPPPDSQPYGFTFTLEAFAENGTGLHSLGTGGYNFGSLSYHGGRTYLTAGSSISEPTGSNWNAYVVVNITNNLGYIITIEDLTAEVTDGTPKGYGLPGDQWLFPISGENVANCSMVALDTFDPWDYNLIDEVNYDNGVVEQIREEDYPDHFRAITGTIRPSSIGRGPGALLLNDLNGDALSTGHVAPKYGGSAITLNDGETFTDYFGVNILGDVAVGTQINATITLRLYYSPPLNGTTALADVQMSNLQPMFPAFYNFYYGPTAYMYPDWSNLAINVTLQNRGNVPLNVTVNLYYSKDYGGTWTQIGIPQSVLDLAVATGELLNFYWNVKAANLPTCWKFIKANATATNQYLNATCEMTVRVRTVLTGNADGDSDVDVGDQRKTQLAMFTSFPQEGYLRWNNAVAYGPQIFTDFDGDGDVDVGDQRKQALHMFCVDPCEPKT